MRPRRLASIAGLMAFVLLCGVGVAALRSPTLLWVRVTYTLALAFLGLAVVGVLYRDGSERAFWAGFLVFGGGYWVAASAPWVGEVMRPKLATSGALDGLETMALGTEFNLTDEELHKEFDATDDGRIVARILTRLEADVGRFQGMNLDDGDRTLEQAVKRRDDFRGMYEQTYATQAPILRARLALRATRSWQTEAFRDVGHAIFTILVGILGGLVASYFHRTRNAPCPDDAGSPSPRSMT